VNLTRELSGYTPKELPANIIAFRKIQQKIAQLALCRQERRGNGMDRNTIKK